MPATRRSNAGSAISYVDKSINPGLPPVEKCLYCHNYIIANHPEIQKEHDYFNSDTPTPWVKVYELAEHVLFNHERHIKKDIACESCHDEVRDMDRLKGQTIQDGILYPVPPGEKSQPGLLAGLPQLIENFKL